jgi:hypothetical protein
VVVSLAVFPRGVNLSFMHGAHLPDPHALLEGSGTQGRFIRLTAATTLTEPAIEVLLRAAEHAAKSPVRATGSGYTVIKAVSARQRLRRPAAH